MNLLWFLWPVSGYILWSWVNHMLSGDEDRNSRLRWVALGAFCILGPISILPALGVAIGCFPEDRWGLRFR